MLAVALAPKRRLAGVIVPASRVARRRPHGEGRTIRIDVKVNAREHQLLFERAQMREVAVARLLVESALELPLPRPVAPMLAQDRETLERAVAELHDTRRDLGRLAGNFNQLARVANETGQAPSVGLLEGVMGEYHAIVSQLMHLSVRLSRFSKGFGNARGWAPEGEDEPDQGSEQWWARRIDAHRVHYGLSPSADHGRVLQDSPTRG